jgi:hypothetical protein
LSTIVDLLIVDIVGQTEDIWFSAPRKGVVVFALPGERCVTELNGDFKVHFNDRHGDFYWFVLPPSLSCYIMLQMESGKKSFCRLANLFPLLCNIWNVFFHCMSNLQVVAVG